MITRKIFCLAILFFAFGVSRADAQWDSYSHRNIEITPFGGTRFAGTINVSDTQFPVDYLTIKTTWNYGVIGDVDLFPNLQAEFMWNRQPSQLGSHDASTGITTPIPGQANLDMYQWSFLYELRPPEEKLKPFFVTGVGFTHFGGPGFTTSNLGFSNGFSYNLGGGVKYFFAKHVGVRLEARYSPSRTTYSNAIYCDPFYGCFAARVANHANQGQANLGLIFRF